MTKLTPHRLSLQLCDTDIHWSEAGEGPPLVLLHGIGDSHHTWDRVVGPLSERRRVIVPDLPGHGLSGRPDATYTLSWHSRVIHEWMAALDLWNVDLVGHSFGGGIAFSMLQECPERLRRLALACPGGLGRGVSPLLRIMAAGGFFERVGQPFMGKGTRLVVQALRLPYAPDEAAELGWMNARPGTAMALSRTVKDVISWRGQSKSIWDHPHHTRALPPMALMWGENDKILPISQGIELFRRVQGLEFTRFEKCGHYPHREIPDLFVKSLLAFLESETVQPIRVYAPTTVAVKRRALFPLALSERLKFRRSST